jgi:hypothetical protein
MNTNALRVNTKNTPEKGENEYAGFKTGFGRLPVLTNTRRILEKRTGPKLIVFKESFECILIIKLWDGGFTVLPSLKNASSKLGMCP